MVDDGQPMFVYESDSWKCDKCGFLNPVTDRCCYSCGNSRPRQQLAVCIDDAREVA